MSIHLTNAQLVSLDKVAQGLSSLSLQSNPVHVDGDTHTYMNKHCVLVLSLTSIDSRAITLHPVHVIIAAS